MAQYTYRGRNADLAMVSGTMEANSLAEVVRELVALKVAVVDINAAGIPEALQQPSLLDRFAAQKITEDDVILLTRQLHTLQRTAVPILRALGGLQESTANRSLAGVLGDVRLALDQGFDLSTALGAHPKVFSPFYVAMVRVGEISGQMVEVLNRLFIHLEFEKDVRAQISEAMRYPIFVLVAASVGMIVLNMFVIPVFAGVFAGLNAPLPPLTRMLIGFSNGVVKFWPLLALLLVGGVFGIRTMLKSSNGRYWWDRQKLRLPIVGDIILKATLAKFARSFALASQSGIPVLQGLTVVSRTADNAYVARCIEEMRDGIERGESLARSAAATGVFTPVVLQMIAVGEETGEIDALLTEIAGMYERETAYSIKGLATKIEPIILVLMGAMVLVLALGIFLPMWSLGQAAMGRGGG